MKILSFVIAATIAALGSSSAYAVHVNGYTKSNGTYVAPHERSAPDGNPYNNYRP